MAWMWYCNWENGTLSWEDWEGCNSYSRKSVKDKKHAERLAQKHEYRFDHHGCTHVRKIHGNRKLR